MGTFQKTPFGEYLAKHEIAMDEIPADWRSYTTRLRNTPHKIGANSPSLAAYAKAIGRPLADLQKFASGPLLNERMIKKAQTQIERGNRNVGGKNRKKGKGKRHAAARESEGKVLGSVEVAARELPTNGKRPGKALAKVKAAHTPAQYNRLKKGSKELRQSARTLVTMYNVAIMRGDTMIDLPLGDLYYVLHDWLTEKGVPTVLVTPRFQELFDRKF